jgi:hypothetical protein
LRAVRQAIEILRFFKGGNRRDEPALGDCQSFFREGWIRSRTTFALWRNALRLISAQQRSVLVFIVLLSVESQVLPW